MVISRRHYNTTILLSVALLMLNALMFREPLLGAPISLLYAAMVSLALGKTVAGKGDLRIKEVLPAGLILFFALWTVLSSLVYWFWRLALPEMFVLLTAIGLGTGWLAFRRSERLEVVINSRGESQSDQTSKERKIAGINIALGFVALLGVAGAALLLFFAQTEEAIRSPWQIVSPRFLPLLGIVVGAVIALSLRRQTRSLAVVSAAAVLLLSLLVATIVYRIGYGFDPFIHEAAMRVIIEKGAVTPEAPFTLGPLVLPKTPYYIGAYADLVSLERLTAVPLHALNRAAGPLIAFFALLAAALIVARMKPTWLAPIAVLLAVFGPLNHFIQTTPQGIADALTFLTAALLYLAARQKSAWPLVWGTAAAAATIHPIAGAPALGAAWLLHAAQNKQSSISKAGFIAPLLLILFPIIGFSLQPTLDAELTLAGALGRLKTLASPLLEPALAETLSAPRALLYGGRALFPLLILALAAASSLKLRREGLVSWLLFPAALATGAGGLLFALVMRLPDVIPEEQAIFPLRFISLGGILLFPLALSAALEIVKSLRRSPLRCLTLVLLLMLMLPSTVYLSYPRTDPEDLSKGYNVSAATISAVDLVHKAAKGSFLVLANQTAAAAEIWKYGFSQYLNGEFYFSHPSGAPRLNQYFLEATNLSPSRELMEEVMSVYNVDSVYLLVHDYWKRFPDIVEEAVRNADAFWEIDGGKVWVFEYRR